MASKTDDLFLLAFSGSGDALRSALEKQQDTLADVDSVRAKKVKRDSPPYVLYRSGPKGRGLTLLHVACAHGNLSCVETLLELGASPSVHTSVGLTRFDVDFESEGAAAVGGETCLHLAAASGSGDIVDLLLSVGADIDARSANGCTPLMKATTRHEPFMEAKWQERLRSKEADDEEDEDMDRDYYGRGLTKDDYQMVTSFQEEESKAAANLIAAGADLDAHCKDILRFNLHARTATPPSIQMDRKCLSARVTGGMTALHWAVSTGDYGIAKSLVAAGADVNAQTTSARRSSGYSDTKQTPLHFAVELGDVNMVRLLMVGGADVNVKDRFDRTPLHQIFAVLETSYTTWSRFWMQFRSLDEIKCDRLIMAILLLEAGADRDAEAVAAETPGEKRRRRRMRREGFEELEPKYDTMLSLAELNPDSGGPEVVEFLTSVTPEPHCLQSACRRVIRKRLSRPILYHRNVDCLPLPSALKEYITLATFYT